MHHGSVGLGAGRQVLAIGLTEDAVLVVLLDTGRQTDVTAPVDFNSVQFRYSLQVFISDVCQLQLSLCF